MLLGYEVEWRKEPLESHDMDCYIFMWCDEQLRSFLSSRNVPKSKVIAFLRRYEFYHFQLEEYEWDKCDAVICVNDFLAGGFHARTGVMPHILYNAVNLDEWTYRERGHGKDIAWVGFVNQKKNLPLALQILHALGGGHRLHIAGGIQDMTTVDYCMNLAERLRLKIRFYGHIQDVNSFLEDKNYLLSTAISEGCPNNVIEAMAKGIKPVVHNWPGSLEQFRLYVFDTVQEAVSAIHDGSPYHSKAYRGLVESKFGMKNFRMFRMLVDQVIHGTN